MSDAIVLRANVRVDYVYRSVDGDSVSDSMELSVKHSFDSTDAPDEVTQWISVFESAVGDVFHELEKNTEGYLSAERLTVSVGDFQYET